MKERNAILLLWATFLFVAAGATYYGLVIVADSAARILVAVVAASAGIMTAVVSHSLQRLRELELERLRKREDNYANIVQKLAEFLRDPDGKMDDFTSLHLLTWVVGSPDVVRLTRGFMRERHHERLDMLLIAMRRDLHMSEEGLQSLSTKGLIGTVVHEPTRGLG